MGGCCASKVKVGDDDLHHDVPVQLHHGDDDTHEAHNVMHDAAAFMGHASEQAHKLYAQHKDTAHHAMEQMGHLKEAAQKYHHDYQDAHDNTQHSSAHP